MVTLLPQLWPAQRQGPEGQGTARGTALEARAEIPAGKPHCRLRPGIWAVSLF